jgi:hypothetical protein
VIRNSSRNLVHKQISNKEQLMQNKKLIVIFGILVILVGAAAFMGGRLLNGNVNPLGLGIPIGGKDFMSISVQVTPAPELPTRQPEVTGLFAERKDNSIFVSSVSMNAGGKGVVVNANGGGDGEPALSGPQADGPKKEVVITGDTTIYLENTDMGEPKPGENIVLQQSVTEGSLDDLTSQSFVTVWGRKSGDRIIAEVLFISNPVIFKRPAP